MKQVLRLSQQNDYGRFTLSGQHGATLGYAWESFNKISWSWRNALTGKCGKSPTKTEARKALIESLDGFVIEVKA